MTFTRRSFFAVVGAFAISPSLPKLRARRYSAADIRVTFNGRVIKPIRAGALVALSPEGWVVEASAAPTRGTLT